MSLVRLTVDIYCNRSDDNLNYRVYVDDELMTERSWTWPSYEFFVREHIEINVDPGSHTIAVHECSCDAVFRMTNLTVDGNPIGNTCGVFFV